VTGSCEGGVRCSGFHGQEPRRSRVPSRCRAQLRTATENLAPQFWTTLLGFDGAAAFDPAQPQHVGGGSLGDRLSIRPGDTSRSRRPDDFCRVAGCLNSSRDFANHSAGDCRQIFRTPRRFSALRLVARSIPAASSLRAVARFSAHA